MSAISWMINALHIRHLMQSVAGANWMHLIVQLVATDLAQCSMGPTEAPYCFWRVVAGRTKVQVKVATNRAAHMIILWPRQ